ncbi:hypothetical protein [Nocardia gamkensis]|uniref:hypothetical protein n=1 Tax=Nocardia gamkensis TaxID=352869 RepID=UPI0037CB95D9
MRFSCTFAADTDTTQLVVGLGDDDFADMLGGFTSTVTAKDNFRPNAERTVSSRSCFPAWPVSDRVRCPAPSGISLGLTDGGVIASAEDRQ